MDGLITKILAGVIVVLIGACAAYYFGVRQERLKQAYEKEKEERTRLEERQSEVNKQRAEAFGAIRTRANSLMGAVNDLSARFKALPAMKPARFEIEAYGNVVKAWALYWRQFPPMREQVRTLQNEAASLQLYFQTHESNLEPSTRELFRAFDEEVIELIKAATLSDDVLGAMTDSEREELREVIRTAQPENPYWAEGVENPYLSGELENLWDLPFWDEEWVERQLKQAEEGREELREARSRRWFSFRRSPMSIDQFDSKVDDAWRELTLQIELGYREYAELLELDREKVQAFRTAFDNEMKKYDD